MEHRHRQKNKKDRRPRKVTKSGTNTKDIMSIEEFRAKYLPGDERRRAAHNMTPEEIGEELARMSLDEAKQVLSERKSSPTIHR